MPHTLLTDFSSFQTLPIQFAMNSEMKIGLIGLDTSHASAFAKLLNDPSDPHYKGGARVTCAWPGGSADFPRSADRVAGFTAELRDQRGVEILESPEAVARAADLVFITAVDARVHLDLLRSVVSARKPIFIDKPFALSSAEAREMIDLAARNDIPLMSGSSLRYSEQLLGALETGRENITGCDFYGPMNEEETQPGLFWYGCHTVEVLVSAMGPGCKEVRCVRTDTHDALTAIWADGRIGTIHGVRDSHWKFGGVLHRKEGPVFVDASAGRPYYLGLLDAILESLPNGCSAIPPQEMLDAVRIMEAANLSRSKDGIPVSLK